MDIDSFVSSSSNGKRSKVNTLPSKLEPSKEWTRPNKGEVVQTINKHLSLNPELDQQISINLQIDHDFNQMAPFRFMNDKLISKSEGKFIKVIYLTIIVCF
jgi:hypothetical protein